MTYHADIWPQSSLPIRPSGVGFVKLVHDLADELLRFPRLTGVVVKIRDVVRRLVAVGVLADEAGNVGLFAAGEFVGRVVNSSSSFAANFSCPPCSSISRMMSCGTKNVY